jgi:Mrp family chromosome partitioning ATPase
MSEERIRPGNTPPLRRIATRVHGNLWLVPGSTRGGAGVSTASLHSYLGELRREFEYSIVEGPAYGMSADATAMAQFADGIILVLSAQYTRRATARKIKQSLLGAQACLLGTVLIDRVFPIPQGLYRRL